MGVFQARQPRDYLVDDRYQFHKTDHLGPG